MFTEADMRLFKHGAGGPELPRFDFDAAEPDRIPGMARSFVLTWCGVIYSVGESNYARFPDLYRPFVAMGITEPMLAMICLWLGVIGLIGGLTRGFAGWAARMLAAMWSAAFWTTAAIGMFQGRGLLEIIAITAYTYVAFMSWRHLVLGGRA